MTIRVALAAVAGAHGVRGELRLKLFADDLASLSAHREVWLGERRHDVVQVGGTAKAPVLRLSGIADRSAAEALRGTLVEVDRAALPPLGEGEYYHADLIGLTCIDGDGAPLGTVVAVENFGAGDLLEVERDAGKRALIPFRAGIADREGDCIRCDPAFLT